MSLYDVKPRFRQLLVPLADRLCGVSPNVITWIGVAASTAAVICMALSASHRVWLLLVPVWLFMRIACNALDGLVAQRSGRASPFGEVLNESTDRIADVIMLLGVGLTPWASLPLAALATVSILLSSYVGVLGKAVGVGREYGGMLGKADRILWMGLASLIAWQTGAIPFQIASMTFQAPFDVLFGCFIPFAFVTATQRLANIQVRLQQQQGSS